MIINERSESQDVIIMVTVFLFSSFLTLFAGKMKESIKEIALEKAHTKSTTPLFLLGMHRSTAPFRSALFTIKNIRKIGRGKLISGSTVSELQRKASRSDGGRVPE